MKANKVCIQFNLCISKSNTTHSTTYHSISPRKGTDNETSHGFSLYCVEVHEGGLARFLT